VTLLMETLDAVWRVTLGGLVLGVGAPVVFAAGMAALGLGRTVTEDRSGYAGPVTTAGGLVAGLCFLIVAALVVGGVVLIAIGD
jgi:hypothetical protein